MSYIDQPRLSINDPKWDQTYKVVVMLYKQTNMPLKEIAKKVGVHYRTVNVMIYDFYFKTNNPYKRS